MNAGEIKEALKDVPDSEEVLVYASQGEHDSIAFLNRRDVTLYRSPKSGKGMWYAPDNGMIPPGVEHVVTKKMSFFVRRLGSISPEQVEAHLAVKRNYPISKHSEATGWVFVKEMKETTYAEALKEAGDMQEKDKGFTYRIWDER